MDETPHDTPEMSAPGSAARRRPRRLLLASLALLSAGCGEAKHYAVDLDGNSRRVDEDGRPLAEASDGSPAGAVAEAAAMGPSLRGTITLQPDLGIDADAFACVFVVVRRDPMGGANFVRKLGPVSFPMSFEITARDSMTADATMSGGYTVLARLDSDGDAMSKAGDVQGIAGTLASAGGEPVSIVLNQVLARDGAPISMPAPSMPGAGMPGAGMPGAGMPGAGATAAGGAPFAPFAGGASAPPTAEEIAAAESGPRIEGTVELDPAFDGLAGHGRLFVFVRSAGAEGGMPIAVVPIEAPRFPASFTITTLNVALQVDNKADMLSGNLKISARLSLGGNAMPAAGDIESEAQPIKAGEGPVTVRLTRRRS